MSIFKRIAATESTKKGPPSFKELGLLEPLTPEEQKRVDEMEADLPSESILMFRKMSRSEASFVSSSVFRVSFYHRYTQVFSCPFLF